MSAPDLSIDPATRRGERRTPRDPHGTAITAGHGWPSVRPNRRRSTTSRLGPAGELLVAATAPARQLERLAQLVPACPNWSAVFDSAEANGVLHGLASVLSAPDLRPLLPQVVGERVAALARYAGLVDGMQRSILSEIIDRFARAGVPFILLKGLGLAERLYDRPFERVSVDIDVLVPRQERSGAEAALGAMGYTPQRKEFYEEHHFHVPFRSRDAACPVIVELHWQLTRRDDRVQFAVDGWWERARALELRSGRVLIAPAADELAYVCHHAFAEGPPALRDLMDVARLCERTDVVGRWTDVLEAADRAHAALFLRQALTLAGDLWELELGAIRLPEVPRELRVRQWLVRNLVHPRTVLEVGPALWWPFKRLCRVCMFDREVTPWRDLLRGEHDRWVRAEDDRDPVDGQQTTRRACCLGLALGLCCLPSRWFPRRFRRGS